METIKTENAVLFEFNSHGQALLASYGNRRDGATLFSEILSKKENPLAEPIKEAIRAYAGRRNETIAITKFNVAPSQDLPKTTRGWNHVGHVRETPDAGPEGTYNLWIRTGKESGEPHYEYKGPGDSREQGWFYPVTDEEMPYLMDTGAIILTTKEGHRLIAQVSGDADCPGIYLILQPKDGKDQTVGLMEFIPMKKREETTCEKGNGVFRLLTWDNGKDGEDPDEIRNIRETD